MALNTDYSSYDNTKVQQLNDRKVIADLLSKDRISAAYALANLDPGMFAKTEWYLVESGESQTVAMMYKAFQPSLLFSQGTGEGLALMLESAIRSRELYFSIQPDLLNAVSSFYHHSAPELMIRMKVKENTFRPQGDEAMRLSRHHVHELNSLYRTTLSSVFSMDQIENGIYFGIWHNRKLVSVAGTHFISPLFGVASVGNVYTHPDYRGKGYASQCAGAVTEELLKRVSDVVLNVNSKNDPAIKAYTGIGFKEHCRLAEMLGTRKNTRNLRDTFLRFLTQ